MLNIREESLIYFFEGAYAFLRIVCCHANAVILIIVRFDKQPRSCLREPEGKVFGTQSQTAEPGSPAAEEGSWLMYVGDRVWRAPARLGTRSIWAFDFFSCSDMETDASSIRPHQTLKPLSALRRWWPWTDLSFLSFPSL